MTVPVPADMVLLVSHRSLTSPSETLWVLYSWENSERDEATGLLALLRG